MKLALKILKVFGFIMLMVIIYVGGMWLDLPLNTRLLGIIIVIFLYILLLLNRSFQANRGAALLEKSIRSQADEQIMGVRPSKREEIEQVKQQLEGAIGTLKKSKLGSGLGSKAALYALPWYMIIGPSAAGKTTAIQNSGLNFPFGHDPTRGVGGTRNCDWFFSDSTILIDTAGRYMTEDEDREEWLAFLDMLKKYRRHQAINGVIVGMNIDSLANATADDLDLHATNIRRCIDELIHHLGLCFPVYLVFMKCDLLQGFVEFFEDLNRLEREQIWGCSLSREQQKDPDPRSVFEKEFQKLFDAVIDARFSRLNSPMKRENRRKVFVFPLEFDLVQQNLAKFTGKLFQPNPYQDNPIFRGFYFTSGTQEGIPLDRVIQAIADQFDLPAERMSPFAPEIETKSYFIKDLFTEVIVPDRNLVSKTSRVARQKRILRISAFLGAILFLALFILGVTKGYISNTIDLNNISEAVQTLRETNWEDRSALTSHLTTLDNLNRQIQNLQGSTSLLKWELYRGDRVHELTQKLYLKEAGKFVKIHLYQTLTNRLQAYVKGTNFTHEKVYNYLKAYLLMGSKVQNLQEDKKNREFLIAELHALADEHLFQNVTDNDIQPLRPLVNRQINYFVNLMQSDTSQAFENNPRLIQWVRRNISKPPSIQGIYDRLKHESWNQLRPFTLSQALGGRHQTILRSDFEVPGFFTKIGWESYVQNAIEVESSSASKEDWVLGERLFPLPEIMKDKVKMSATLHQMYFNEYARTWWKFLKNIEYEPFDNIGAASERLRLLADFIDSPLMVLINSVAIQTQFENQTISGLKEKSESVVEKMGEKLGIIDQARAGSSASSRHPVDRHFAVLHELRSQTDVKEGLGLILNHFLAVSEVLESLQNEPEIKAKEYVLTILNQPAGELPDALKIVRRSLADFDLIVRKELFEQPIHLTWAVLLKEAHQYLNSQWRTMVYEPYQMTLMEYYPINSAGKDVPKVDLDRFFNPQNGALWVFLREELNPFIKQDLAQLNPFIKLDLSPLTWEDQGILLSQQTVEALNHAKAIVDGLFQEGNLQVSFNLKPELPGKKSISGPLPDIKKICLNIDGLEKCYQFGYPAVTKYSWPATEALPGASLEVFTRDDSPVAKQFSGDWAWFRLLQAAQIRSEGASEYRLQWLFTYENKYKIEVKYRLYAKSRYNPFNDTKTFFHFSCPNSLN
ncbi:type VI secretion system membrane subunit TssM [candidate division CSSED10-310 bacterium]|uniref:Type VI secretion system membrane subunit TssM n=1 Tax=candidate division CSSED10-310 bacterium TaxID=2855610 RepID=A0ABV6YYK6_UNCC1